MKSNLETITLPSPRRRGFSLKTATLPRSHVLFVLFSLALVPLADRGFVMTQSVTLIAANLLFAIFLLRGGLLNADVYVSTTAIRYSVAIILAGVYLLGVGALARAVRYSYPSESLPLDAFLIFISLAALAILLLSNRSRRPLRLFVSRHFRRPVYDYQKVWMELIERTASIVDVHELSTVACRIVSKSLEFLSVTVWLVDESQRRLTLAASTPLFRSQDKELEEAGKSDPEFIRFMREHKGCMDLDDCDFSWPKETMQAKAELFREYRMKYAIGLHAGGELVGVMTLNDDLVEYEPLGLEDLALLETLAAQLASSLLNLKLWARLRHAKQIETFQNISTFFVHDLKNVASRLSLTMQNLPENYDNPEFRADALRVISGTVAKIDGMCERLSMLKQGIELRLAECDLKSLVSATLNEFKSNLRAELKQDLQPVPRALMDPEQIHKVLTNLVMNANEAVNGNGVIQVTTIDDGSRIGFAVRDNGCGMSDEFIEKSLFRPFQTTKKRGLGIGLFHSKLIVEAHRGTLEVKSAVGAGTEFRVLLPLSL